MAEFARTCYLSYANRTVASLGFVWVGDPDEGRQLVPLVAGLGAPLAERVEELSYLTCRAWTTSGTVQARGDGTSRVITCPSSLTPPSTRSCPRAKPMPAPTGATAERLPARLWRRDRRDIRRRQRLQPPQHLGGVRRFYRLDRSGRGPRADGCGPTVRRRSRTVLQRRLRQRAGRRGGERSAPGILGRQARPARHTQAAVTTQTTSSTSIRTSGQGSDLSLGIAQPSRRHDRVIASPSQAASASISASISLRIALVKGTSSCRALMVSVPTFRSAFASSLPVAPYPEANGPHHEGGGRR